MAAARKLHVPACRIVCFISGRLVSCKASFFAVCIDKLVRRLSADRLLYVKRRVRGAILHRIPVGGLILALGRWRFVQTLDYRSRDQSVAARVVMVVSEDEETLVPAARPAPRALVPRGQEPRKQRDEAFALVFTPFPPDAHLPGVCDVVRDLGRPGIDNDTD